MNLSPPYLIVIKYVGCGIRSLRARIVLIDMASRVLPSMSERSSRNAERQLRRLGVELLLNIAVTGVDDAGVTLKQGPSQAEP